MPRWGQNGDRILESGGSSLSLIKQLQNRIIRAPHRRPSKDPVKLVKSSSFQIAVEANKRRTIDGRDGGRVDDPLPLGSSPSLDDRLLNSSGRATYYGPASPSPSTSLSEFTDYRAALRELNLKGGQSVVVTLEPLDWKEGHIVSPGTMEPEKRKELNDANKILVELLPDKDGVVKRVEIPRDASHFVSKELHQARLKFKEMPGKLACHTGNGVRAKRLSNHGNSEFQVARVCYVNNLSVEELIELVETKKAWVATSATDRFLVDCNSSSLQRTPDSSSQIPMDIEAPVKADLEAASQGSHGNNRTRTTASPSRPGNSPIVLKRKVRSGSSSQQNSLNEHASVNNEQSLEVPAVTTPLQTTPTKPQPEDPALVQRTSSPNTTTAPDLRWACPACTFDEHNTMDTLDCIVCGMAQPKDAVLTIASSPTAPKPVESSPATLRQESPPRIMEAPGPVESSPITARQESPTPLNFDDNDEFHIAPSSPSDDIPVIMEHRGKRSHDSYFSPYKPNGAAPKRKKPAKPAAEPDLASTDEEDEDEDEAELRNLRKTLKKRKTTIGELESRNRELEKRNSEVEKRNREWAKQNTELEKRVKELEARPELQGKVDELETKLAGLEKSNKRLKAENARLAGLLEKTREKAGEVIKGLRGTVERSIKAVDEEMGKLEREFEGFIVAEQEAMQSGAEDVVEEDEDCSLQTELAWMT